MLTPLLVLVGAAFAVQLAAWAWLAAGFRKARDESAALAQPFAEAPSPADEASDAEPRASGLGAEASSPSAEASDPHAEARSSNAEASRSIPEGLGPRLEASRPDPEASNPGAEASSPPLPFSVVVAARDEASRLPALLDALGAQAYDDTNGLALFEVVLVDDGSADETAALAEARALVWARRGGPDLRIVRVPGGEADRAGMPRKKHALTRGVAHARHDRLAFTDADCAPPLTWLAALARHAAPEGLDEGAVLVGFGPYEERPGFLNLFIRYETLVTAYQGAAAAEHGRAFHAVGRNLSYPKSLFEKLGGFGAHAASLSGDDDLLVQAAARAGWPVRFVADLAAHVPSPAPERVGAWLRQKRRHASAGRFYSRGALAALALFHGSNLAQWLGALALHLAEGLPWGWGLLAVKLLLQRAALSLADEALSVDGMLSLAQPVLDGLYALYQALLALLGALPVPRRW